MKKQFATTALLAAATLVLAGCSSSAPEAAPSGSPSGASDGSTINVVASTNVYGDIAEQIGGDLVSVTSLIDSPDKDPHEFEATSRDQLAISEAQLIVQNGGGYDAFIQKMIESSGNTSAPVINASELSGLMPPDADESDEIEGFNEHVWYNFDVADKVAKQISDDLAKLDPKEAKTFAANYETFSASLGELSDKLAGSASANSGKGVAITEPVPLYMLEAAGLTNKTPDEFSEAIEEGTDVAPAVLQETLDLFSNQEVVLLAYNTQTESGQTQKIKEAATAANIPVVDFTETLPVGKSYLDWMGDNVDNLLSALG